MAGAFHTAHMAPAQARLEQLARGVEPADPRVPLLSNQDGQVVTDGAEVLRRLVTQVTSPVRWDLCMQTMLDHGVTALVELAPAGTLTGLAKRAMKGVELVALKTPDDLETARRVVAEHAAAPATPTTEGAPA